MVLCLRNPANQGDLLVFDDFSHARAARFALERALIMVRFVRLDPREPHGHSALSASRVHNFEYSPGTY